MINYDKKEIGLRIKKEMKQIGYSETAFALVMGTTRQTVAKWVNGEKLPPFSKMLLMCEHTLKIKLRPEVKKPTTKYENKSRYEDDRAARNKLRELGMLDGEKCIAKFFDCELAYLLGDIETKKYVTVDISKETGLNQKSISLLHDMRTNKVDKWISPINQASHNATDLFPEFQFASSLPSDLINTMLEESTNEAGRLYKLITDYSYLSYKKQLYQQGLPEELRNIFESAYAESLELPPNPNDLFPKEYLYNDIVAMKLSTHFKDKNALLTLLKTHKGNGNIPFIDIETVEKISRKLIYKVTFTFERVSENRGLIKGYAKNQEIVSRNEEVANKIELIDFWQKFAYRIGPTILDIIEELKNEKENITLKLINDTFNEITKKTAAHQIEQQINSINDRDSL